MEPDGSLPCSQEPATGPSLEPDESSPFHPISIRSIFILSYHLRLRLPSGFFTSGFPIQQFSRNAQKYWLISLYHGMFAATIVSKDRWLRRLDFTYQQCLSWVLHSFRAAAWTLVYECRFSLYIYFTRNLFPSRLTKYNFTVCAVSIISNPLHSYK
jgi:hypothetical protein